MKDIIKQLKENEKPFGLMSKEMQDKARELDITDFQFYAVVTSTQEELWDNCIAHGSSGDFNKSTAYRLRPDYEESGVVECDIFRDEAGWLCFRKELGQTHQLLHCAVNHPDFIGFKCENGSIDAQPRVYKCSKGYYYNSVHKSRDIGKMKVLTPTHVLFKKEV